MKKMMHFQPRFAIIDHNILTGMGLQSILEDIIPVAEISVLQSVEELQQQGAAQFVHFFVSSRIYFEHAQFFREQSARSIVLVNGEMSIQGVKTLNVCQSEKNLVRDILKLSSMGSRGAGSVTGTRDVPMMKNPHAHVPEAQEAMARRMHAEQILSPRETEVALLLAKGYINKEVADHLNISLTTVITHRKNIMEKLHARSLADIIVYVVMNGMIDVSEL